MTKTEPTPPLPLPDPSAEQLQHSAALLCAMRTEIEASGPLGLDRFWELAQYDARFGYYTTGAQKFGSAGDFVTAPELGDVFGGCLARQLVEVFAALGRGCVLELGAGSGALAATVLIALERVQALPERYMILDRSGELRQRQRTTLQRRCPWLLPLVVWLDAPPASSWQGVVFGNEVVDALPARRFQRREVWHELKVGLCDGKLQWVMAAPSAADVAYLQTIESHYSVLPDSYITEFQPQLSAWLRAVTETMRRGVVLLIDYGYSGYEYFHPERAMGTLIAHYRHRAHDDILLWPGLQDISVSVDFSHLARAARVADLTPVGYIEQALFLMACGLADFDSQGLSDRAWLARTAEIKQLTLPSAMGERFKVFAAHRDMNIALRGFDYGNRLRRL